MAGKYISTIPKTGIGRVVAVSRAVGSRTRGLTRDAIAGKLSVKAGTGSANNRVIAAKKFGLIELGNGGGYVLTELGSRFAIRKPERADIEAAIRNVDVFDKLLTHLARDPASLSEAEIRSGLAEVGVGESELGTATRVFMSSWNYKPPQQEDRSASEVPKPLDGGGLRAAMTGDDQVAPQEPAVAASDQVDTRRTGQDLPHVPKERGTQQAAGVALSDHPLIRSILAEAPPVGGVWSVGRREAWLEVLRTGIRFVYPEDATG